MANCTLKFVSGILLIALPLQGFSQNLADLFAEVSNSVVVIGTIQNKQLGGGKDNQISEGGLGSGVVISEDGLIWTAAHVVQVAEAVKVKFKNGEVYDARVMLSDPNTDLAMIRIDGPHGDLHAARTGNSDSMRIGDDIFVIGAPRGLEFSLSRGVVSGRMKKDSPVFGGNDIEFLQVDASVNPGNSGGPVFNMKGEVIGIASFILTESGGFEGIGFAATSNIAQDVLMNQHPLWGGMEGMAVSGPLAKALNIPGLGGYLILSTSSKGLAAQLGLQGGTIKANIEGNDLMLGGDVILELAGVELYDEVEEMRARTVIGRMKPGDEVEVKVLRGGEVITKSFTL